MLLLFRRKVIETDVFFAFCAFLAGCTFFVGLCMDLLVSDVWYVIETLGKITVQSNLVAFLVSGIYFFNPNHRVFRTNILPLSATVLLFFAGLGFWLLLFPIYYIGLNSFIVSPHERIGGAWGVFYGIWNHTVTQIVFLIFFYFLSKKKNIWHLIPVPTRASNRWIWIYFFTWLSWNIFASKILKVFPNYGFMTNFNTGDFYADDAVANVFNLKMLIFSHLFCLSMGLVSSTFFSRFALKFRAIIKYELMGYENSIVC